jgi:cytoskeletal protein RodZ
MNSNFFKGQQLTLNIHFARIILVFLIISISLWSIAGCEQANTTSGQNTSTPVSSSTSSPQPRTTGQPITTAISVSTTTTKATTKTTITTTTTTATTKPQTTESSQTNQKTKFSQADLTINGVSVNATPEEAEQVLGKPETTSTAKDQLTGLDVMTNSYDGLQLLFMNDETATNVFKLKYVEVMDEKYTLARGLKIGMSAEAALQLFC